MAGRSIFAASSSSSLTSAAAAERERRWSIADRPATKGKGKADKRERDVRQQNKRIKWAVEVEDKKRHSANYS
jgi:hypothetical protein